MIKREILGDKKKSSFDDNLADVVNKIFDNMPEEPKKEERTTVKSNKRQKIILRNPSYKQKTAEEWIKHYKEDVAYLNFIFASMPDVYRTFKKYKQLLENKSENTQGFENAFNELKKTFTEGNMLLTSTKLEYYAHVNAPINCNIIHHSGLESFENVNPVDYVESSNFWNIVHSNEGIILLKTLFDTEDSEEIIREVFVFVGHMNWQVFIKTPEYSDTPLYKTNSFKPLVTYASLKLKQNHNNLNSPILIIDLTTKPDEKGCARGIMK
ncbi:hypothetical protein HZA97_01140 [Candidatus Woesearchaeota archaeon]|nr:hypothetical protein [Candidatus Woesearchaeota archaeon]